MKKVCTLDFPLSHSTPHPVTSFVVEFCAHKCPIDFNLKMFWWRFLLSLLLVLHIGPLLKAMMCLSWSPFTSFHNNTGIMTTSLISISLSYICFIFRNRDTVLLWLSPNLFLRYFMLHLGDYILKTKMTEHTWIYDSADFNALKYDNPCTMER